MAEHAAVRLRGGVVELVHDDVVEAARVEALQVLAARERLDRREDDVRAVGLFGAGVLAERRQRTDRAEGAHRPGQDLVALGDEEDSLETARLCVERAEPRLAEAGGEHDEAGAVAGCAGGGQLVERFLLDRVRLWRRGRRLVGHADHGTRCGHHAATLVVTHPPRVHRPHARAVPERVEGVRHDVETVGLPLRGDAVVARDPERERRCRQVWAADERRTRTLAGGDDARLRVEARAAALEDAQLHPALQVEQPEQRAGLGDAGIVAGEETHAAVAVEHVAQVLLDQPDAAVEREGNGEVDGSGARDRVDELRQERVGRAAAHEERRGGSVRAVAGGRRAGGGGAGGWQRRVASDVVGERWDEVARQTAIERWQQLVRIVDASGDDYLYPGAMFLPIELSREARDALLRTP
jgi:hypothetical protein